MGAVILTDEQFDRARRLALGLAGIELFDRHRQVLMYLEAGHRDAVLERIASLLEPGGLLLLDPSEHLGAAASLFVSRGDGAYSRPAAGRAWTARRSPGA